MVYILGQWGDLGSNPDCRYLCFNGLCKNATRRLMSRTDDVTRRGTNLYSIFGNIKHEQIVANNLRVQISMQTAVVYVKIATRL
jgi:hypothetical protein